MFRSTLSRSSVFYALGISAILLVFTHPAHAFEDEAEAIEEALSHNIVQGVQRVIGQRVRSAVLRGGAFRADTAVLQDHTGLAAGEEMQIDDYSAWLNGDYVTYDDNGGGIATEADVYSGMVGGDLMLAEKYLIGLTVGTSSADTISQYRVFDTPGISSSRIESEGISIAPYGALIFDDNIFIGFHAGVSFIQTETASTGGGFSSSGEHASLAGFLGADANYVMAYQGWEMLGHAGITFSHVDSDRYTNAAVPASDVGVFGGKNSQNTRLSIGGQAGYPLTLVAGTASISALPYIRAVIEYDLEEVPRGGTAPLLDTPSEEDAAFGMRLAVGADTEFASAVIGSVEVGTMLGRDAYDEFFANANLRFPF